MRKLMLVAALALAAPVQAAPSPVVQYATLTVTDTTYAWVAPGASMEERALSSLTSRMGCKGEMLVDFLNCVGKSRWALVSVTSLNPAKVNYPITTWVFMRAQ